MEDPLETALEKALDDGALDEKGATMVRKDAKGADPDMRKKIADIVTGLDRGKTTTQNARLVGTKLLAMNTEQLGRLDTIKRGATLIQAKDDKKGAGRRRRVTRVTRRKKLTKATRRRRQ
jgi:hypothetical protein